MCVLLGGRSDEELHSCVGQDDLETNACCFTSLLSQYALACKSKMTFSLALSCLNPLSSLACFLLDWIFFLIGSQAHPFVLFCLTHTLAHSYKHQLLWLKW